MSKIIYTSQYIRNAHQFTSSTSISVVIKRLCRAAVEVGALLKQSEI